MVTYLTLEKAKEKWLFSSFSFSFLSEEKLVEEMIMIFLKAESQWLVQAASVYIDSSSFLWQYLIECCVRVFDALTAIETMQFATHSLTCMSYLFFDQCLTHGQLL